MLPRGGSLIRQARINPIDRIDLHGLNLYPLIEFSAHLTRRATEKSIEYKDLRLTTATAVHGHSPPRPSLMASSENIGQKHSSLVGQSRKAKATPLVTIRLSKSASERGRLL
jgi:hypothetical protein